MQRLIKLGIVLFIALLVAAPINQLQAQAAWAPNTAYSIGALVTYGGSTYKCIQAHTSLVGWEPPNVPALWQLQGTAPTSAPPTTAPTRVPTRTNTPGTGPTATRVSTTAVPATRTATRATVPTNTPSGAGCFTPYVHGNVYTGGMTVSYNARNWRAKWWTQNEFPSTGGSGVWEDLGACGGGTVPTNTAVPPTRANTPTGPTATRTNTAQPVTPVPPTGGLPKHVITGYWHNFNNGSSVLRLRDVPAAYNLVAVAFADATGTPGAVNFTLDPTLSSMLGGYTQSDFIADINTLHGQGRRVIISVGGQNGTISVADSTAATNFSNSIFNLMSTYGFDGVDIDLENGVNPTFMSQALHNLASRVGTRLIITMAPETIFAQSASSTYLDLALKTKDILTIFNMQYYNSGAMLGCDGQVYSQGTVNFLVALACIQLQAGLRPDQVGLGLPATSQAAGGGYVSPSVVNAALDCLAAGTNCGTFRPPRTWPGIRGAMTWSVNWDKVSNYAWVNGVNAHLPAVP